MGEARTVIVNADDFGQSAGVNAGVIEAHDRGIVTSASLMVRWPAAAEAVALQRARPSLGLGIHLDLGEWAFDGRDWVPRYEVVAPGDAAAVEAEISRQLALFEAMVGAPPTHVDSHQHVHRRSPAREAALAAAARLRVPLRHFDPRIRYCGDFHGQDEQGRPLHELITPAALERVLAGLPEGVTELACHPGRLGDVASTYRVERSMEVEALCQPSLAAWLRGQRIALRSFAGFGPGPG